MTASFLPLVEAPPFNFGTNELIWTAIASLIIIAIVGPKWLRERRKARDQE